ncbi:MAG TPA: SDR family oxidoreductase [Rhizomicrobium sp.]|nr:SDR family oxidoreductase [Rhizomicrobium sp.]
MPVEFLAGKHAVITGGSRGIGAATARALAAAGARVTLMGRDQDALKKVSSAIVDSEIAICDVTDAASVTSAFEAAHKRGPISILVNNAGIAASAPFLKTDDQMLERMFATNVMSAFRCTRAALPDMLAGGWGRVINIASIAGLKGARYISAYVASKHAMVGMTRALAAETAGKNITVNAVCPGYVDTEMTDRTVANIVSRTKLSEKDAAAEIARGNASGKLIAPEEVAGTVAFLCRADADSINGQAIAIGDIG